MKKALLIIFCFINISLLFSQHKTSLVLRDGDTITGFGKINSNDKIRFRKSMNDKKKTYDQRTVKQVIVFKDGEQIKYAYKIVHGSTIGNKVQLLAEPIVAGKINLYKKNSAGTYIYNNGGFGGNGGTGFSFSGSYDVTTYFVSDGTKDNVTYLHLAKTHTRKFKRLAATIFAECPNLIEKIKSNHFGKDGIVEIVEYYNEHCGN